MSDSYLDPAVRQLLKDLVASDGETALFETGTLDMIDGNKEKNIAGNKALADKLNEFYMSKKENLFKIIPEVANSYDRKEKQINLCDYLFMIDMLKPRLKTKLCKKRDSNLNL